MHSVPTPILNAIARTQTFKNSSIHRLFSMTEARMEQALEAQAQTLLKRCPAKVVQAYQTVCPLLIENEAISRFIVNRGSLELRRSLPEVTNVQDAVMLMTTEWKLTLQEQSQLRNLLRETIATH